MSDHDEDSLHGKLSPIISVHAVFLSVLLMWRVLFTLGGDVTSSQLYTVCKRRDLNPNQTKLVIRVDCEWFNVELPLYWSLDLVLVIYECLTNF